MSSVKKRRKGNSRESCQLYLTHKHFKKEPQVLFVPSSFFQTSLFSLLTRLDESYTKSKWEGNVNMKLSSYQGLHRCIHLRKLAMKETEENMASNKASFLPF